MSQDRVGCSSAESPVQQAGRQCSGRPTAFDNEQPRSPETVDSIVPAATGILIPVSSLDRADPAGDPDPNWIRGDLIRAAHALLTAAQTVGSPVTATAAEQRIPAQHVRSALLVVQSIIEHLE